MINYSKKKFLIVDAVENFRLSLRRMLMTIGVSEIDIATNGKEAINKCREGHYDMILCDYSLGGGKNGQQVLEELRLNNIIQHRSQFLMVSAETQREVVLGAMEYTPDGYLSKPFTQALLHKRLERMLDQQDTLRPIHAALDNKNEQQAIEFCEKMFLKQGRYANWCGKKLAELQHARGEAAAARETCKQLLNNRHQDWPHYMLAKIAYDDGAFDTAIGHLKELLEINALFVQGYDLLALCYHDKGDLQEEQKILKQGTDVSPLKLQRQQALATISQQNDDMSTATHAWRATVEQAQNSCLEDSKQYLNFARCLNESACNPEDGNSARLAKEALATLEKVKKRYSSDDQVELQAKMVECQLHKGQGNHGMAKKTLDEAKELFKEAGANSEAAVQMEMGKTLLQNGDSEGEEILKSLGSEVATDTHIAEQVRQILDEPGSVVDRKKAADLNSGGISLFSEKKYQEAFDQFKQAKEFSPRHPGLNLNLIQAVLKLVESNGMRNDYLVQSQRALDRIAHLGEGHKQWERYQFMCKAVAKLG